MKETKPKPTKPKMELREPAVPLAAPKPLDPDHPAARIFQHLAPPTDHRPPTTQPIAPERAFTRVPNSVVRDAIPAGLFRGESKKLYDALYQRTRGGIVPRRSIRATQSELMEWARVSHNTLKSHLKHLSRVGLLKVHYVRGDNTGAEYEVFTPEEAPPTTHQPSTAQNLAPPTNQNLVLGGGSQVVAESITSAVPQTSFKTKEEIDDETALAPLLQAERDLTGKSSPLAWKEVAEILADELRIAAARTTVSTPASFLAEHLRRRLFKKEKGSMPVESKPAVDSSKCPDCGGSGLYYPDGYEKGVAKCPHKSLKSE